MFKEYKSSPSEEILAIIHEFSPMERQKKIATAIRDVLDILTTYNADTHAKNSVWSLPAGTFLINTPEDIALYLSIPEVEYQVSRSSEPGGIMYDAEICKTEAEAKEISELWDKDGYNSTYRKISRRELYTAKS